MNDGKDWLASLRGPWEQEIAAARRGDLKPLIASLRGDKPLDDEAREFIAEALEPKPKPKRGRPTGDKMVIPHGLRGDQWVAVGRYDKTYPAVAWVWQQQRAGVPLDEALEKDEFKRFGISANRLHDWLRRARVRGPIGNGEADS